MTSTTAERCCPNTCAFEVSLLLKRKNGAAALQLARERKPAVVLMDLRMPDMDGWQATEALRNDPATEDVIVIAISAHVMNHAGDTAFAAGCDAFIPKPFDITAVADGVTDVFLRGREGLQANVSLFHRVQPLT